MAATYTEIVIAEVRAEMGRQRLSQPRLAEKLGWTQATLSRRLTGTVPFATDELEEIAAVLGVPVDRLVSPAVREVVS